MTALSSWVPRYIVDPTHDLSGTPITAQRWNDLWLINQLQGDDTARTLKQLVDEIYTSVWHPTSAAQYISNLALYAEGAITVAGQLTELHSHVSTAEETIDALGTALDNFAVGAIGAFNHNDISARSAADAHPMSAITGLVGHTHTFASAINKPTTLAGFGITDAAAASHIHTFSALSNKPSTLAGYGITDAAAYNHAHTFAAITNKPTTLNGYGITDAALTSSVNAELIEIRTTAEHNFNYEYQLIQALYEADTKLWAAANDNFIYKSSSVITLADTAQFITSELQIGVPANVFNTTPLVAIANCSSASGVICNYRYDASTPTTLVFWYTRCDGGMMAGQYRFSLMAGK